MRVKVSDPFLPGSMRFIVRDSIASTARAWSAPRYTWHAANSRSGRRSAASSGSTPRTRLTEVFCCGWPFASVKIVSVCPQNRRRGIETINGVIEVFDARTGLPCARVHAESVTVLRTGAQAATQLEAIHCVRPLREVLVFGRDAERAAAFCRHWSAALGIPVRGAHRDELVRATLVATATTSPPACRRRANSTVPGPQGCWRSARIPKNWARCWSRAWPAPTGAASSSQ